ncbi:uncharacterized protein LOC109611302 [Ooceraea biroi]|uniref:uncharacterized protein LOC109611302 n=1 Tax=Ooceraea biroi TaxID=2015173 RepID=UPI00097165DA|nr:uncharacterized protein LOC109611302 [Ooceraea biroi]
MENDDIFDTNDEYKSSDTDNEEENILNTRRGQKRMRFILSSESESDEDDQRIETAADGTVCQEIKEGSKLGRAPLHNIFRDVSDPTGYAKRNIMKGKVRTTFSLIIAHRMMEHIRTCTEAEAFRVLGAEWNLTAAKLDSFIALICTRRI